MKVPQKTEFNMYLCCTYAGQIQLSYRTRKLVPPQTWTIRLTASIPRPQESKYTSPLSLNNRRAVQCEAKITSGSQLWNTHTHIIPLVSDNDALLLKNLAVIYVKQKSMGKTDQCVSNTGRYWTHQLGYRIGYRQTTEESCLNRSVG
jgi:hypothetical protein